MMSIQTITEGSLIYTQTLNPLLHGQRLSLKGQASIVAMVIGLFFLCTPVTICRRISNVIVPALNGMFFRRSFAHIGQKVFKRLPAVADCNPAAAVDVEPIALWIRAAVSHIAPCHVSVGLAHSMASIDRASSFAVKATTALRMPVHQLGHGYSRYISTLAQTLPKHGTLILTNDFLRRQLPESVAGYVFKTGHRAHFTLSAMGYQ